MISVDTYKAAIAEAALEAGAHIVNDVWGFHADPRIAEVAARHAAPVILMHNRSSWANTEIKERLGGRYVGVPYENLIEDVCRELLESVALAQEAGIPDERIILDPGVGFGKTVEQNLELIDRLAEIRALGYPVLPWTLAQILHRLYPQPASGPAAGRHGGGGISRHLPGAPTSSASTT